MAGLIFSYEAYFIFLYRQRLLKLKEVLYYFNNALEVLRKLTVKIEKSSFTFQLFFHIGKSSVILSVSEAHQAVIFTGLCTTRGFRESE